MKPTLRESPAAGFESKIWNLLLLAVCVLLMKALWFSASAVLPQLSQYWRLSGSQQAWMTISVQLGFVAGALLSALLNLADRIPVSRLIAASGLLGALMNALIPWLNPGAEITILLRFLTGMCLAGVYPPAMKLVVTWSKRDRGFWVGVLIGALTLGSALPHLLNALGGGLGLPPWEIMLHYSSLLAVSGSLLAILVRNGPYHAGSAPFNWRYSFQLMKNRPLRLANLGYLGHMWELYAMWTWVPLFLMASFQAADLSLASARLMGFATVGIGALGCITAGLYADRLGRTTVTIASLAVSGCCALLAGWLFSSPMLLSLLCLIWGFAVVADSAQFSAAVSELADPRYVGTALTLQTSLGFLLSAITIQIIPPLVDSLGWTGAFMLLALGPAAGIAAMARLRRMPEALKMAGGKR